MPEQMTQETFMFLKEFFNDIWHIFVSTPIPGTNMNCANLLVGIFGISVIITFIKKVLDSGASPSVSGGIRMADYIKSNKEDYDRTHVKYDNLPPFEG